VGDLRRHLLRKRPCPPILTNTPISELLAALNHSNNTQKKKLTCCHCGKMFSTYQSRWYHNKTGCCHNHQQHDSYDPNDGNRCCHQHDGTPRTTKGREVASMGSRVQQLEETILVLQEQLKRVTSTPACGDVCALNNNHAQTITNNNNHISQTNTTIVINGFGKETMDHITAQFLDQCVRRRDKGLIELIEKIHFDPDHQENCNLRMTSMKAPLMQIHNGTNWRYERKDKVLNELVDKGHGMMQEHFDDHEERIREDLSESMFNHIRRWMEHMQDREKKTLEAVLTDMYILILNTGPAV
jgi:polyhydroxyalkanoate synthesis regulator phasin